MNVKLGDTVRFGFATHRFDTGAVVAADALPTVQVYEAGSTIAGGTVASVATGQYEAIVAATVGNGYEAGKNYTVMVQATVNGVAAAGCVGNFQARTLDEDSLPAAVWTSATRTLTSFGTLVADLWAYMTRTLTTVGAVAVTQPMSADGTQLTIVRGDDYLAADSRQFEWTAPATLWPDLTGATVNMTVRTRADASLFTVTMSVIVPTGAGAKVRAEIPSAKTKTLIPGCKFDVEATLAVGLGSHIITLANGSIFMVEDQTRQV